MPGGVVHLRGDRPLPDELVEAALVAAQLARELGRGAEAVAGGPDRLVGLLGVLHPAAVDAGRARHRALAVEGPGLVPGGLDGRVRQRRRVGPHVGDVAPLVEALGDLHRPLRREAQLARRLLLERRGDEGRGRRAPVGALLEARHLELGAVEGRDEATGGRLVEEHHLGRARRASPSGAKSSPVATWRPPISTRRAAKGWPSAEKLPSTLHQLAERNRMRSRSRSTTIRVATLCTRPADRPLATLRQSTGETS